MLNVLIRAFAPVPPSPYHLSDGCVQPLFYPAFANPLVLHCHNLTTYFIFLPRIMLFWNLEAVGVTKILPSDGELRYSHCDTAGRHHVEASHDAFFVRSGGFGIKYLQL